MSSKFLFTVATVLMATVNAHIKMTTPVPFSVATLDTSPLTQKQFPCKKNLGYTVSTMNSMAVGESQQIKFEGTAVHGGGSCQLSVTTDTEPTENSVFKVIKSIEGGCPGVDGTTNTYDFTLPASIPNGKATFAWTWFSKLSGAPELYMNCAPIEVTGGASDDTAFKALPNMLVANIDDTCKSPPNKALKFPNPGSEVMMGGTNDLDAPTGSGCGSVSNVGSSPVPSAVSPISGGGYTPAPSKAPLASATPIVSASPIATPIASAAPIISSAPPANASAAPHPSTKTTLLTVTASRSPPVQSAAPTPVAGNTPASGGSKACTQEGAIVCNGTTKFGLCNNGQVVWQDVAAGTTCSNGVVGKREFKGRIARRRVVVPKVW